jgi:site-specific recombinase XerD
LRANVGDLRRTDEGAVIHLRGKGGKDRRVPIEPALVQIVERYLDGIVKLLTLFGGCEDWSLW